jgi:RTA1 like protein
MVAGLAFQVASLLLFALLCIEYGLRVRKHVGKTMTEYSHISNTTRFRLFLYGMSCP